MVFGGCWDIVKIEGDGRFPTKNTAHPIFQDELCI
jgi:hypothetical protein